jgi:FlaA1/EpsC-like NDP-sugar epimerase
LTALKSQLPEFLLRYRRAAVALANLTVAAGAYSLACLLRFDFSIPPGYRRTFVVTLIASVVIHYAAFYVFKLTRGWWRYAGIGDFLNALKAAFCGGLGLSAYLVLFERSSGFPRSVLFLNAVLIVGLSVGMRLAVRLWRQMPLERDSGPLKRLAIIGAGDTGEALLREVRQSARLPYKVVAFLDDDLKKRGAYIDGVPVVDEVAALADVVARFGIDEIVVATPSASGNEMRVIIDACRAAGKPFKVLPATWEVLHGRVSLGAAREVDIHDLLRRPPVELDVAAIGSFLRNKRVLVTGAAGSIGSEICRQVLRQDPRTLMCVDHDENALFYLERDLARQGGKAGVQFRLGDITDERSMQQAFASARPQVVFHAAAHKHVPMLEANPIEGLRNNVFGTELVARVAARHGAEAFVLISTDKAVNPSSVMGASKRIAELLIRSMSASTRYTAVRFGNVLGSQGSVVPLLKEQIAAGGPVTITHPDMARYFMTIPEAVELVIQASTMGQGDEVFMLDMGEPVKIVDLATDLITLSGLRPHVDIEIAFIGVRPGEKLSEELHLHAEIADTTSHPKILVAKHARFDAERFRAKLAELRRAVTEHNDAAALRLIPELVPEFRPRSRTAPVELPARAELVAAAAVAE